MERIRFASYSASSSPIHTKLFNGISFHLKMGRVGLEPTYTEVGGFTVRCNCHYATYPYEIINKRKFMIIPYLGIIFLVFFY